MNNTPAPVAIDIVNVSKSFLQTSALRDVSAQIRFGELTGIVGPDGAGKTTLLRLLTALLRPDTGHIHLAGFDSVTETEPLHAITGYMPQRFGLYEDLSVLDNLRLYARLRLMNPAEQPARFEQLLAFTRLGAFQQRLAGKLSGGMKQKLGLACALMGQPRVLLLDEPGVGVDPVSRLELWQMVDALLHQGLAVVWSTAYLDEAERCQHLLLLDSGQLLFQGPPAALTDKLLGRSFRIAAPAGTQRALLSQALRMPEVCDGLIQGEAIRVVLRANAPATVLHSLNHTAAIPVAPRFEDAFVDLLGGHPGGHSLLADHFDQLPPLHAPPVSCTDLSRYYGTFVAADRVNFSIRQGEIFGLLGPNGAGKSTTFRMLCGLLRPSSGQAKVMGYDLRLAAPEAKRQLGYMAQKFSLYGLLSVQQNLEFSAGVYGLSGRLRRQRVHEMIEIFQLSNQLHLAADQLPLGIRQRLALACALMHRPAVLFLDEPTSGVDPLTRREFWTHIYGLVHKGVSVLVTTHFMEEAEYCDRVALMYQSCVIALDTPDALKRQAASAELTDPSMEQAFIRLIAAADRQENSA